MIVSHTGKPSRWLGLLLWLRFALPDLLWPVQLVAVVALLASGLYRGWAVSFMPLWVEAVVAVVVMVWVARQARRWR